MVYQKRSTVLRTQYITWQLLHSLYSLKTLILKFILRLIIQYFLLDHLVKYVQNSFHVILINHHTLEQPTTVLTTQLTEKMPVQTLMQKKPREYVWVERAIKKNVLLMNSFTQRLIKWMKKSSWLQLRTKYWGGIFMGIPWHHRLICTVRGKSTWAR